MAACGSRQDDYSRRMIAPFLLLPSILFPANRSRSASPRTTRPGAVDRPAIDLPKAFAPAVTADVLPRDDRRPIDASPQWRCSGLSFAGGTAAGPLQLDCTRLYRPMRFMLLTRISSSSLTLQRPINSSRRRWPLSRRYPLAPLYETRSGGTDCRLSSRLPRNNRGKARIVALDPSQARLGRALVWLPADWRHYIENEVSYRRIFGGGHTEGADQLSTNRPGPYFTNQTPVAKRAMMTIVATCITP